MKFIKIIISIFIIAIFYSIPANSKDKVAFIDIDFVIKNSIIGKSTLKKIEELNTRNIQILKKREKILKDLDSEIKKKQNVVSKEEFNKEVDILKTKIKEFKIEKNEMVNEYNKIKNKELENLFKVINPIIKDYMNKNSIEILLDRKNVFIGSSNSDLTKILIDEINKNNN